MFSILLKVHEVPESDFSSKKTPTQRDMHTLSKTQSAMCHAPGLLSVSGPEVPTRLSLADSTIYVSAMWKSPAGYFSIHHLKAHLICGEETFESVCEWWMHFCFISLFICVHMKTLSHAWFLNLKKIITSVPFSATNCRDFSVFRDAVLSICFPFADSVPHQ